MLTESSPMTAPADASARERVVISWQPPQGLVGVSFYNFFMRIVTFGFHQFWGKTEVRRRIWAAIRLNGEPLTYTGTGKELFKGFLILMALLFLPLFIVSFVLALAAGPDSWLIDAFTLLFYVAALYLFAFGYHRAQRYRLTRTRWRGIHFNLVGSSGRYAWTSFWTALLIPFTLGWIAPWRMTKLQGMLTDGMRFGDRPFRFSARSAPLYPRFAVFWVTSLVLLGLILALAWGPMQAVFLRIAETVGTGQEDKEPSPQMILDILAMIGALYAIFFLVFLVYVVLGAWYRAYVINHFAAHTELEGATFKSTVTPGGLVWMTISNLAIVLLTLGLLGPVALARGTRYFIQNLSLTGELPMDSILQGEESGPKHGEGLAQMFDIDGM